VRLITSSGYDWTKRFPWIVESALKNRQKRFVVDGEAVILGVDGISDFDAPRSGRQTPQYRAAKIISSSLVGQTSDWQVAAGRLATLIRQSCGPSSGDRRCSRPSVPAPCLRTCGYPSP
jgi:hypothetical protein